MLRGGHTVGLGCVHDDNAALAGGSNVDIVDPDTGATDHLQVAPGLQHPGVDPGTAADDDGVVGRNGLHQLVLGKAGPDVVADVCRRFQPLNAIVAQLVGYQDLVHVRSPVVN